MTSRTDKAAFDDEFPAAYRDTIQAKIDKGLAVDVTEIMWMVWKHA